jgi:hypothetical protein
VNTYVFSISEVTQIREQQLRAWKNTQNKACQIEEVTESWLTYYSYKRVQACKEPYSGYGFEIFYIKDKQCFIWRDKKGVIYSLPT